MALGPCFVWAGVDTWYFPTHYRVYHSICFPFLAGPAWSRDAIYLVISVSVMDMNHDGHLGGDVVSVSLSMNGICDDL